ncbi:MAG: manganese transporter permease [Hyphomicrobiaceae bacterium]|nr:MAG: manganese transporter permease [Hyphomicrobiaceae bacterium]
MGSALGSLSTAGRLWIYQAERFPLLRHGALIAIFAASGVSLSAVLAGRPLPSAMAYLTAFALCFLLFFQLRVSDEVKDNEDDRRFRPERPVPRGLVSLRLLVRLALLAVVIEALLALFYFPGLLPILCLVWAWMGLMAVEFFAPVWLKARPLLYLGSHMLVMPLVDLLVSAVEWLPAAGTPPPGLVPFLILSFLNGTVLELGRKTWAPESERTGVESYSSLWGPARAGSAWMAAAAAASLLSVYIGVLVRAPIVVGSASLAALILVLASGRRFLAHPTPAAQNGVENAAGVFVLLTYIATGILPALARGL